MPDSTQYKMIFEITDWKEKAYQKTAQLNRLHSATKIDTVHKLGIVYYRLYLPIKIKNSDSARITDSLKIFFGSKITALKQ